MNFWKLWASAGLVIWPALAGCDGAEPTNAVLSNEYPSASDAASAESPPVYRGWWSVAQFPAPVPAGQVSEPVRIVPGSDYGYALLAPGWDQTSGAAPSALVPVRSAEKLSIGRGESLTFVVSARTTVGDCRAGNPLTQADADYVTQHIFAAQFAGLSYDAASCTTSRTLAGDAGAGGSAGAP